MDEDNDQTATCSPPNLIDIDAIRRFASSESSPEILREQAAPLLAHKDLVSTIRAMESEIQTGFIDNVDKAYRTIHPQNRIDINVLGEVCSQIPRLPTSAVVSVGLKTRIFTVSGYPVEIWRGNLCGAQVAVKVFHAFPAREKVLRILLKRIPVWRKLCHPNILRFHGVNTAPPDKLSLVYNLGKQGNIMQYISSNPDAPRPPMLLQVAKGLDYLHNRGIPHGCLKVANVVIDHKGNVRLTDYGMAPITLGHSEEVESKPADVLAFGKLGVDVMIGKETTQTNEDILKLGFTDEIWRLFWRCLKKNPHSRPVMKEIVRTLLGEVEAQMVRGQYRGLPVVYR